jgi:hypothetical protein
MSKQFYDDDAFYVEQKKYGLWQSHYPDGSGIITSLNELQCVTATRWYLKAKQEGEFNKSPDKSYSGEVGGKL